MIDLNEKNEGFAEKLIKNDIFNSLQALRLLFLRSNKTYSSIIDKDLKWLIELKINKIDNLPFEKIFVRLINDICIYYYIKLFRKILGSSIIKITIRYTMKNMKELKLMRKLRLTKIW